MTPEHIQELTTFIQARDNVTWAAVVGEFEGKHLVHAFVDGDGIAEEEVRLGAGPVTLVRVGREGIRWLTADIGMYATLLARPGLTLIGEPAADRIAERLAPYLGSAPALRSACAAGLRTWVGRAHGSLAGTARASLALNARMLYAYVQATPSLPTQAEFEAFGNSRGEPWALAWRAARHSRANLDAATLQMHRVDAPSLPHPEIPIDALQDWWEEPRPDAQQIARLITLADLPEAPVFLEPALPAMSGSRIDTTGRFDYRSLFPGLGV